MALGMSQCRHGGLAGSKFALPDEDEEGEMLTHLGRSLADEDFKQVGPPISSLRLCVAMRIHVSESMHARLMQLVVRQRGLHCPEMQVVVRAVRWAAGRSGAGGG